MFIYLFIIIYLFIYLFIITIDRDNMFKRPVPQTLKRGDLKSRISRCVVCMRRPPERMLALDSDRLNRRGLV